MMIELKVVVGGVLLGVAAGMMMLLRGRILGCSSMFFRCISIAQKKINPDNVLFILGLMMSGFIYNITSFVPNHRCHVIWIGLGDNGHLSRA